VWGSDRARVARVIAPQRATAFAGTVVVAAVSVLVPSTLTAQPARPVITDADIARASRNQPVITDQDIEKAAKKHRMPTEAELARVPVPSAPRLDALPQPRVQRQIDLGAIARGYEAMGQPTPGSSPLQNGPSLLVFVSFSMPEPTLGRLIDQAARSGATLVLRGLVDGSLQQTVLRAQRLIGQRQVGFQIDPQAFDRFSVSATPTFVLLKAGAAPTPCAAGTCFASTQFVSAAGDVSIDYALEFFKRSAPSFSREAGALLSKLKGG
jgi:conjugal transfer pilus assembly protein TrbC